MNIEKLNAYIKNFLRKNEFIKQEDNVIHMEKAFVVASVLRYCIPYREQDLLTDKQIKVYFNLIAKYKENKVDILWEGNEVKYKPSIQGEKVEETKIP